MLSSAVETTVSSPLFDRVCERCRAQLPSDARSCPRCGSLFASEPTPLVESSLGARLARMESFVGEEARLVLLRGSAVPGTTFPIPREGATLGRAAAIRLADETLASDSVAFEYRDDLLFVRDRGSPSGVFVRILSQVVLEPGRCFAIGDHRLRHGGLLEPPSQPPPALGAPWPGPGPLLRLEAVLFGGEAGRIWLLPFPVRIGRQQGEIVLSDRFVSARHCALHLDGEEVILEDLGSTNGTFVEIPADRPWPLRRGDTLRVGRNIFRVQ